MVLTPLGTRKVELVAGGLVTPPPPTLDHDDIVDLKKMFQVKSAELVKKMKLQIKTKVQHPQVLMEEKEEVCHIKFTKLSAGIFISDALNSLEFLSGLKLAVELS